MIRSNCHLATWSLRHSGQSTIELLVGMIGTMTLFIGVLVVWSWLVGAIIARQRQYDETRPVAAGLGAAAGSGEAGDISQLAPKKLSVWDEAP